MFINSSPLFQALYINLVVFANRASSEANCFESADLTLFAKMGSAFALPRLVRLMLLLLLPCSCIAQRNISLGSSITANASASIWVSSSGDFAFGFQEIGAKGFLLAVWFNKIPEKTIVWCANCENLVPGGSKVQLTVNGALVLSDPNGRQIWTAESAGTNVSYAAMLDSGNFVLANQNSVNLWESFDHPTDTILPTQPFNLGSNLVARYSEINYTNGRFLFMLRDDGNLVLSTTNYPQDSVNAPYWETNTAGSGYQLIFNQSGSIYLIAQNKTIVSNISSDTSSTRDFYHRAIVDFDGVFRHYVYPKSGGLSSQGWKNAWTVLDYVPPNICMAAPEQVGSGPCGFNSYCQIGDDQRPTCLCPLGYSYLDPQDEMNGCRQDFESQNCEGRSDDKHLFDLYEMTNTDWPFSDYEHFDGVSEDWCRAACLGDCFCAVAIFRDGNCWKKKLPLSNGRIDPRVGGKALLKIRKDNNTSTNVEENHQKDNESTLILVGSVMLGGSVSFNCCLLLTTLVVISQLRKRKVECLQRCPVVPGMNLLNFTYKELEEATDGFKEEVGRGAFATVYKGVVQFESTSLVAVKKLEKKVAEGDKGFKNEMSAIGRTNHKNLVQLLGFCNEGPHHILVYEFMSNGSMADFLFGNIRPRWYQRVQIAFGTARGLSYLHDECSTQIIHCDIKPQNILLDSSFTAKISDFGISKLLKTDQTGTMTNVRGTKGYVAPEWFRSMPITVKVDVYSFGVLLLELICCRKNFETDTQDGYPVILTDRALDCYRDRNLDLLVEDDEEAKNDIVRVEKFVMITIWCIQDDPSMRPTMKKVTQMLEGAVDIPAPPEPTSFISTL
ncbi:Bulb-type lectin domain [Dillenia turbinata]|uniref:Receptor-like serine/threonine-protein kinase n=1 Tax=Dillenia turbinata TaxID=194707 RepID=A0AAN8Z5K5_9MAGN